MDSFPIFGEERTVRLPRPGLVKRWLFPRRRHVSADEDHRLAEVISCFGVQPRGHILTQSGGKRNEAWMLQADRGRLLLKRYRTTFTRPMIDHEHSILEHLETAAFPAPRLVRDRGGSSLVEVDGRFYVLFDYLEGYAHFDEYFYYPRQQHWLQDAVGRTLGRLHAALRGFTPRGDDPYGISQTGTRERDLAWYLKRLAQARELALRLDPGDPGRVLLDTKGAWLGEQLQEASEAVETVDLDLGIIHGDYGPNNMLFKPGAPPVVLDFELARRDWLLIDLAAALSTTCPKDSTGADWARLMTGYLSENPIPVEHLRLLPQIWKFQSLRRAIICSEQYANQPRLALLTEAERRIGRAERTAASQAALVQMVEECARRMGKTG